MSAGRGGLPAAAAAVAAAALWLGPPSHARAAPVAYELDPQHTWVHFEVLHFGTSTIRGRIGPVTGTVELDRGGRRGRVALAIDVATVATGLPVFDRRLREADLLDTTRHPQAWFVAERWRFDADGSPRELRGEFTFRGVSQPLSLQVERFGCRQPAGGGEVCGGDFTAELDRSRFGADFGLPFVADRVRLLIQAEGRRR